MYVLSIDPGGESGGGGETGIALGAFSDDSPYTLDQYWAIPAGVDSFRDWYDSNHLSPDFVLCEDFIQWKSAADISPLKVVGAVQFVWPQVLLRRAGQRRIITDDQMKALGAYVAGGHHRDVTEAARHGVAWLVKDQRHTPTQREIFK